ncbi:leucine-rich repeat neuronal protein 2 [Drosophila willistoni]|nr:leucine-rich repeat neuronal protein 2 [Drosophila willistoni]
MKVNMKRLVNFALLLLLLFSSGGLSENIDADDGDNQIDRFCYPESKKNTRTSCECNNVSASPWGMRALHIDCSYKYYKTDDLNAQLPLYIDTLDLSWNNLNGSPPIFISDSLHQLNLMHNNISQLINNNFAKLNCLRELYLGWNSISQVGEKAFSDLPHLQTLDLAHNNLFALPGQLFMPLLVLNSLDLSWNRKLNQTTTSSLDLYGQLGINSKLSILRLDACNLSELYLPEKVPLKELSLRRNLFERVPKQLPSSLVQFDISDNLLEQLLPEDTANLTQVRQLYVEDMPRLQSIAAHALVPIELLETVSFQNSRKLSHLDSYAFGINPGKVPTNLKTLIFRGTLLRGFNSTFLPLFQQLTELDLNGVPLHCDCELAWLKDLKIETNGRCYKPSKIRGLLVSSAKRNSFSCDTWPRWAYGLIVLCLIALCAAGVYLLVMGLRPHRAVTMRRKVGSGSPYARVTIEPNRQENFHH